MMLKTLLNRLGLRKVYYWGEELSPVGNVAFYRFLQADLKRFKAAAEENGKHDLAASCQDTLTLIEQRIKEAEKRPKKFYQDKVMMYVNEGAHYIVH